MDIIITHANADFDAFASQLAAWKLYPEAHMVLGRRVGRPVRDFLALHKDTFPAMRYTEIKPESVRRIILVDVRRADRLSEYAPLIERVRDPNDPIELIIYDHHPASSQDLVGTQEVIEPVGSATTLLIEALLEAHKTSKTPLTLDRVEATLLAIGIHSDTGSLTYANTTARDAHALAWILEQGISLKMLNRYLAATLSTTQRDILSQILSDVEIFDAGGIDVGVVSLSLDRKVENLAVVTTRAMELAGYAALFAVFHIKKKRVQIIARASVPYIDVSAILQNFGGGGHAGAGAAQIKKGDPAQTVSELLNIIQTNPPRPRAVRDVMSSPVHTVSPNLLLSSLANSIEIWKYTGLPVVRDGKLIGIISRRDLERARTKELLHLPVSSCMASQPKTIAPDAPLDEALEIMVDADIGRLPVLDEHERIIGIITRSDLIRIFYGRSAS